MKTWSTPNIKSLFEVEGQKSFVVSCYVETTPGGPVPQQIHVSTPPTCHTGSSGILLPPTYFNSRISRRNVGGPS